MTDTLAELAAMTPTQLRDRWAEDRVRGTPPLLKHALVRGIAWKFQAKGSGGLDAETRRLLKAAVRGAPQPRSAAESKSNTKTNSKPRPRTTRRTAAKLKTGTTLVRTWHGRTHEVTVLDDGNAFRYRDAEYASLSEIAREITGARWSGPRFFGLTKLRGSA